MNEKKRIDEFITAVFKQSKADETYLLVSGSRSALTRFSGNQITQNVEKTMFPFTMRIKHKGKVATIHGSSIDKQDVKGHLSRAMEIAENSNKQKSPALNGKSYKYKNIANDFRATEKAGPQAKADAVKNAINVCKKAKLEGAGIMSNDKTFMAIATSRGAYAYHEGTTGTFSITAIGKNSSGWAEETDADISNIDSVSLARTAVEKAKKGRNPKSVKAGKYTVILEPAAVADLISFLGYGVFNTTAYIEGRSFLSGKMGKKICGKNINVKDDPYLPNGLGIPFDFEAFPRKSVQLIKDGVFTDIITDSKTAKKLKMKNTGHSLGPDDTWGPIPLNICLEKGNHTVNDMIKSTKNGILVTRFHYVNMLNPMQTTITGMTRNGTFIVKNGKVAGGVKNFRFTQSIIEALNNVEMIGNEGILQSGGFWGGFNVPAMKIKNFNFTSVTDF